VFTQAADSSRQNLLAISSEALVVLLTLCAWAVLPIALFGLLSEFLQTGPVWALEKVSPKLNHLDPIAGIKRIFSLDSVVELLKSIVKILLLLVIACFTGLLFLPDAIKLVQSAPSSITTVIHSQTVTLVAWTMGLFSAVAMVDFSYQKYSHNKKMMMSLEDIKQEYKNSEGDPHIKQHRRQLAHEWAQENAEKQAREATVLLVNPTHVAIAIQYDKKQVPIPTITARGIDDNALAMRKAAQAAQVPVLKNIPLARKLLVETSNGDVIPSELFNIIAEIILWSESVRKALELNTHSLERKDAIEVPGEDLTFYSNSSSISTSRLLS